MANSDAGLTLTDVSRDVGLSKTTTHRLLHELEALNALQRDGNHYRIGTKLFELGGRSPLQLDLRDTALPFMEDLYEVCHETVHLAVLDGTEPIVIEKLTGHRRTATPSFVGSRAPAHCTAIGKALLAFSPAEVTERVIAAGLDRWTQYTIVVPALLRTHLREVAEQGYAVEREESTISVVCAAAPVFGPGRQLVAAISVAAPAMRMDPQRIVPAVRTSALALTKALCAA